MCEHVDWYMCIVVFPGSFFYLGILASSSARKFGLNSILYKQSENRTMRFISIMWFDELIRPKMEGIQGKTYHPDIYFSIQWILVYIHLYEPQGINFMILLWFYKGGRCNFGTPFLWKGSDWTFRDGSAFASLVKSPSIKENIFWWNWFDYFGSLICDWKIHWYNHK